MSDRLRSELLVQALLQQVREQPAQSVMLQPTLVVRASSGG